MKKMPSHTKQRCGVGFKIRRKSCRNVSQSYPKGEKAEEFLSHVPVGAAVFSAGGADPDLDDLKLTRVNPQHR